MPLPLYIDTGVLEYFAPWIGSDGCSLTGTAGTLEPSMARQHFLFHTAMDTLCFCQLHPKLLERPGSNVFTAIGLWPTASRMLELKTLFPNARTVGVFDDDLCGRVLDCKVALWQMRRDASFFLHNHKVTIIYRNSIFNVPVPNFSLHRFRKVTGMRSTYRTVKPKGCVSFSVLLVGRHRDGDNPINTL
ncbi:hypothetical protein [Parapedobacter soli]|uniref:hypothetical protein n=1 Tax=Parapedobacter soli TaxID=416955 RepID=UPI0021C5DFB7|nr:hypothetical protein [Parapedobacter soli]